MGHLGGHALALVTYMNLVIIFFTLHVPRRWAIALPSWLLGVLNTSFIPSYYMNPLAPTTKWRNWPSAYNRDLDFWFAAECLTSLLSATLV